MPAATLRSWVLGATHRPGGSRIASKPLIRPPAGNRGHISFNNLVEAHVLRALRTRSGVTMAALRTAIAHAERALGIDRLLLRDELRTTGQNIIFDRLGGLTSLSKSGELAMRQLLAAHLKRVDRDLDTLPLRFYPLRPDWPVENRTIVIDPHIYFGRPTLAGSGISTTALVDRVDAGEDLQALAHDYRIKVAQIRAAVLYERAA